MLLAGFYVFCKALQSVSTMPMAYLRTPKIRLVWSIRKTITEVIILTSDHHQGMGHA